MTSTGYTYDNGLSVRYSADPSGGFSRVTSSTPFMVELNDSSSEEGFWIENTSDLNSGYLLRVISLSGSIYDVEPGQMLSKVKGGLWSFRSFDLSRAPKVKVCTCGVKFTGGACSSWCDSW
jgi:hypothetical protein